jgi:hypothetical protein
LVLPPRIRFDNAAARQLRLRKARSMNGKG